MVQAAIDLIKRFEGCELTAYKCPAGIWTIGYGQTGSWVVEGLTITQEDAELQLQTVVQKLGSVIADHVVGFLTENQLCALVSFVYNIGIGAFRKSTLLKKLNAGDVQGAADEFLRWDKAGGKVLPGLVKRRAAERELFLKEDTNGSP